MEWYEVSLDHLSRAQARKVPKWARRCVVDDSGTLFVPAVIAGAEMMVLLCAGFDGTPAILDGEHTYYPADWMAREFPETKETVNRISERISQHRANEG